VLKSVLSFLSAVGHWLWRHKLVVLVAGLIAVAGAAAAVYALNDDNGDDKARVEAPAPEVIVREVPIPEDTDDLGFPAFATKNTTRVAGPDPISDAAAVALAVFPSTGGVAGPGAVTLVDVDDWQSGLAASSLVAAPVGAPILVTESGEVPAITSSAIRALGPEGSSETAGRQIFTVGAAAKPDGFDSLEVEGANSAELAAGIDELRERLAGKPDHIVLVSSDEPALAMPAAAWAARSGDPVLFVQRESVPAPTVEALERYKDVPVFVLGPESAIEAKTMKEIKKLAPSATRIGAEDATENSVEFARYTEGTFGWDINDPGHGFVLANTTRPLDAGVASPLSASGTWGPLLVTESAGTLPAPLRGYLLDLKPGYADDPTRALYNHIWLVGDTSAISVDFQAQVDEIAEVAPVTSGSGSEDVAVPPGTLEGDPTPGPADKPADKPGNNSSSDADAANADDGNK